MAGKGKYHEWLEPEGLLKIEGWARDGLIDKQIAHNIGVSERTFTDWKKRFSSISAVLKKGKEVVDRQVENALLNKALGSKDTVNKPMKVKHIQYNDDGRKISEFEEVIMVEEEILIPPDTTAQIFWLKNRKPAEWRDKRDVEHSGGMNNTTEIKYEKMTEEELDEEIAKLEAEFL